MNYKQILCLTFSVTTFAFPVVLVGQESGQAKNADQVIKLWPKSPPDDVRKLGAEKDFTKPTDRLIAGKRIIKLGNVATPELHLFSPPNEKRNGTSVIVCPGGGFSILAWDLEGTEVAQWLNSIGVTAFVLKYRVPTRDQKKRWLAPTQDAQRSVSTVRSKAKSLNLKSHRIGILGFSAGGATAAMTSVAEKRLYESVDDIDKNSFRPDFSVLIYPYLFVKPDGTGLMDGIKITKDCPPTFFVHAFDDPVRVENSLLFAIALKKVKVPTELHVYDAGGHGYGLRQVENLPVTKWPKRCEAWMNRNGWLKK